MYKSSKMAEYVKIVDFEELAPLSKRGYKSAGHFSDMDDAYYEALAQKKLGKEPIIVRPLPGVVDVHFVVAKQTE